MFKLLKIAVIATFAAYVAPATAMVMCSHGMADHDHESSSMVSHDNGLTRSEYTFFDTPTAWDPGANTARVGGHPAPGGATWSIMGAGITDASTFDPHGGAATSAITALGVAGWGVGDYADMINAMLDVWAAASGFTNLGQVADSGANMGAPEGAGGEIGDIRIGALPFDGAGSVLAHAYQPGTESIFGAGGTIAGDLHMDVDENWTDGAGGFDIFTVMLHELGHALGLGHSAVVDAVMYPFYGGVRRALSADDLAGIQALYGAPTVDVPEPGTLWLLGMGLLAFGWSRRRS